MMPNAVRRNAFRRPRTLATLLCGALAGAVACESESVFEGEPTVAPPVVMFDRDATADRAIHGGRLPVSVVATDDFVGVDSVVVRFSGALSGSFTRRFSGAPKHVRVDTILPVPFGTQGTVTFEAIALNRYLRVPDADTVTATIVRQDTIRPGVTLPQVALPVRVELLDTLRIRVQAQDDEFGSGIARIGVMVEDATTSAPVFFTRDVTPSASVDQVIDIPVRQLPGAATARVRNLLITAFAVDQAGNCIATGAAGAQNPCTANGQVVISNVVGASATTEVTATRTSAATAANGAQVGDMVIDPTTGLVYLTNTANSSVDRFNWRTETVSRTGRALVGAAPLGMTLDRNGQTLIVANSGGTSLSYVDIASTFSESSRFETPNAALFQLTGTFRIDTIVVEIDGVPTIVIDTVTSILTEHDDFSDRPQYLAQDATGVVFYSTVPTTTAQTGAIRKVENYPNATAPEASILLPTQVVPDNAWGPGLPPKECYEPEPNVITGRRANVLPCVIANVDSLKIVYENPFLGTTYDVWDHVPGRPEMMIHLRSSNLYEIATHFRSNGSDIFIYYGTWDFSYWLSEGPNTFVTNSGDRSTVSFAEQVAGRVWNWNASSNPIPLHSRLISNVVNIADYSNNAATQITATAANFDGRLFAARSNTRVSFFTNPLRMIGSYDGADIAGGIGLALHPEAAPGTAGSGNRNWAAVGSAQAEVILVDTRHFRRVGRIALLEAVGGPLRVTGPMAGDAADIVGHIFGVTKSGRVFEVPVRSSDIQP